MLTPLERQYFKYVHDITQPNIKVAFTKHAMPYASALGGGVGLAARVATPFISAIPTAAAISLPMISNAVGGGYAMAEHLMNEDDLKTEELKALIMKYKMLTAKLDRKISNRRERKEGKNG